MRLVRHYSSVVGFTVFVYALNFKKRETGNRETGTVQCKRETLATKKTEYMAGELPLWKIDGHF
jgi:hypothetical protein